MAGSVNKVILVGNLGADPEIRRTQDGRPIVNLRVATSETWRDKGTGERKERTEWHRVVIFSEGLAKVAEQYLKKGARVYLEGQLQTRKWQDQGGQDRYSTEVVLQDFSAQIVHARPGRRWRRRFRARRQRVRFRRELRKLWCLRRPQRAGAPARHGRRRPSRRHGRRDPVLSLPLGRPCVIPGARLRANPESRRRSS